ncbi:MAG: DUF3472 domain-containing protein [Planctomycetaceae bacterium]|nr:DUF3472 domain-containing protein [Planctomycetaceae bacterium]
MSFIRNVTWVLCLWMLATASLADERLKGKACRSVHLWYPAPVGSAFHNELTVEKSAPGTYFMACGWSKGYFGIQELYDGKKVVLFSVWDPAYGQDPSTVPEEKRVKLLHRDPDVRVARFGNEGTGGQSFLDYDWKIGEPCRFLVTARADGPDRTAYSGYFYIAEKKSWKHLVTFSTLTNENELLRGYYSFVEDFRRNGVSATQTRRASFDNGWIRTKDGDWRPLKQAKFTADSNPVLNIDAGIADDAFYLTTGGNIENTHIQLGSEMEQSTFAESPPEEVVKLSDAKQ